MHETTPPLPSPKLARGLERLRQAVQALHRRLVPAPVAALDLVTSAWLSQAVCTAAKLGIADALERGPATAAELALRLDCREDALQRLLRALAQQGVFRLRRDGRFEQSALSACLRSDVPWSIRDFALYVGSAAHREHWSHLERAVKQGAPVMQELRGMSFFDYTRADAGFGALFHGAMTGLAELAHEALLSRYDFSPFRVIVDVGGGEGRLLAGMLARAPHARGILFDRPEVSEGAPALLSAQGVSERCTIEGGSFFERVPAGGDLYVMKHILHDWPDERAREILAHLRGAMQPDATLLLFESVIPEGPQPHLAKLTDMEMLVCLGGRERTRAEFETLLGRSGFSLIRVIETAAPISIIEARARPA